jgi:hypothetical protein
MTKFRMCVAVPERRHTPVKVKVNPEFVGMRAALREGRVDPFVNIWQSMQHFLMSGDRYYHATAIINSCGTGKTRAAVDLCKHLRAVYVGLDNSDNKSMYAPTHLALECSCYMDMFAQLKRQPGLKNKYRVAMKIVYSFAVASKEMDASALYQSQFQSSHFADRVWTIYQSIANGSTPQKLKEMIDDRSFVGDAMHAAEAYVNSQNRKVQFRKRTTETEDDLKDAEPLLIILDGAMTLVPSDDDVTNLRALRVAATDLGPYFFLFMSTSSRLCSLLPTHGTSQPVSRSSNFTGDESSATHSLEPHRSDFGPLFSVGPMDSFDDKEWHPFSYGRPLWRSVRERARKEDKDFCSEVLKIARNMLSGFQSCRLLALFGIRFSLSASADLADKFLRNYLAVVNKVTYERNKFVVYSCYRPEPVLAEVACQMLMEYGGQLVGEMLDKYTHELSQPHVKMDTGDLGEVFTAFYLSLTLDHIKQSGFATLFSLGTEVSKFVGALGGTFDKAQSVQFEGYCVNFTHVYRPHLSQSSVTCMNLTRDDVKSLYFRCCAVYSPFSNNSAGVDMVIPLYNPVTHEIALMLVQVKNWTQRFSKDACRSVLDAMHAGLVLQEPDGVPFIRIFSSVGTGGAEAPDSSSLNPSRSCKATEQPACDIVIDLSNDSNEFFAPYLERVRRILTMSTIPISLPAEDVLPVNCLNSIPLPQSKATHTATASSRSAGPYLGAI